MRKISPRWQFVIILAVLLFLWGGSCLWHSCNRAELESKPTLQELYPLEVELDSMARSVEIDSTAVRPERKSKSSFQSEKMGKHHTPIARDFLEEDIDDYIPDQR